MDIQGYHHQLTREVVAPPSPSACDRFIRERVGRRSGSRMGHMNDTDDNISRNNSNCSSKSSSSCSSSEYNQLKIRRREVKKLIKEVSFNTLEIIEFPYTIGDICCKDNGPSLACSWTVQARTTLDIGFFEMYRPPRQSCKTLSLPPDKRKEM